MFCNEGLILNSEPYYNEASYEKQKGTQTGLENSRLYNEMAILKLVQVYTVAAVLCQFVIQDYTSLKVKVKVKA